MIVATIDFSKRGLELQELAAEIEGYVRTAVDAGRRQYDVERDVLSQALRIGKAAMDWYLQLPGDGDWGLLVSTADGEELERSAEPVARPLRTVFGEHTFDAYVYAPGPKQKIVLRPIDARLQLRAGKFSYLYEELHFPTFSYSHDEGDEAFEQGLDFSCARPDDRKRRKIVNETRSAQGFAAVGVRRPARRVIPR